MSSLGSLFTEELKVMRFDKPVLFERGRPARNNPPIEVRMLGSVQPMSPNEILKLPEHIRTKEVLKCYTDERLFTFDENTKKVADRMEHDGKLFEVHMTSNWAIGTRLPHYKSILVKLDGQGAGDNRVDC